MRFGRVILWVLALAWAATAGNYSIHLMAWFGSGRAPSLTSSPQLFYVLQDNHLFAEAKGLEAYCGPGQDGTSQVASVTLTLRDTHIVGSDAAALTICGDADQLTNWTQQRLDAGNLQTELREIEKHIAKNAEKSRFHFVLQVALGILLVNVSGVPLAILAFSPISRWLRARNRATQS